MPDTSVMVAALSSWHIHHRRALRYLDSRLDAGATMVVAGRTLVETYAVLTRLPPPYRMAADHAAQLIEAGFVGGVRIVTLPARKYRELINVAAASRIAGGRIYDAEIGACAVSADVDELVTFNERDFAVLPGLEGRVVVPPN
jgi:predicted nucleic acid-binding protein